MLFIIIKGETSLGCTLIGSVLLLWESNALRYEYSFKWRVGGEAKGGHKQGSVGKICALHPTTLVLTLQSPRLQFQIQPPIRFVKYYIYVISPILGFLLSNFCASCWIHVVFFFNQKTVTKTLLSNYTQSILTAHISILTSFVIKLWKTFIWNIFHSFITKLS